MNKEGYSTKQKRAVEESLKSLHDQPATVETLYGMLGQEVSKVTVYRRLESLAKAGFARKTQGADGCALYQYVADAHACNQHLHCQCTACGHVLHADCGCFSILRSHLLEAHGFEFDAHRTVIWGLCDACREGKYNGAVDA